MDNHGKADQTRQYHHTFFSFFRFFLGIGVVLVIVLSAPIVVGKFVGHVWGFPLALINLVVYVWLGARQPMAFLTRIIWVTGIFLLICIAGYELEQISR